MNLMLGLGLNSAALGKGGNAATLNFLLTAYAAGAL